MCVRKREEEKRTMVVGNIEFTQEGIKVFIPHKGVQLYEYSEEKLALFLAVSQAAVTLRMKHCVEELNTHILEITASDPIGIAYWEGGHFSYIAYEAMKNVMECNDFNELGKAEFLQISRALYQYKEVLVDFSNEEKETTFMAVTEMLSYIE